MNDDYKNPADGAQPLFGGGDEDDSTIPANAPTLLSGPVAGRPFPFTIVDGKIVLLISWRGEDICDIESEKLQFDSIEAAESFVAGIDETMLAAKGAVEYRTVEPHAERRYFEA
jgi:hypothetical protein